MHLRFATPPQTVFYLGLTGYAPLQWAVHSPEGDWECVANANAYRNQIRELAGEQAATEVLGRTSCRRI